MKKFLVIMTILFVVFLNIAFASAGIKGWLNKITGKATSQTTNVSITVNGTNSITIPFVSVINSTNPTEASTINIIFYATLKDTDGVNDINDSSVSANFSRSGETTRQNTSCSLVADIDSTSANFSCTIAMWYFDGTGSWNVSVGGTDLGNKTFIYNTSTTFTYNQLQAIQISPISLTWASVSPGNTNQTSNNDPTIINNTGNYNIPNITVNGINLHGDSVSSDYIGVGNVTVGNNTGSNGECDISDPKNATVLVNGTDIQIDNTILDNGNYSINNNQTGQELLYYCFRTIPSTISSQTYSTTYGGAWTIKIT